MLVSNQNNFDSADPGALFIASRWHELFDEYTPETFHPKLFNLPSLVSEAVSIGQLRIGNSVWEPHLEKVKDEIAQCLKGGQERTLCSAKQLTMVQRITKATSPADVVGSGQVLELEGFANTMDDTLCSRFRNLDLSSVTAKKSDTDELLTLIATHAFRKGITSNDSNHAGAYYSQGAAQVRDWILASIPNQKEEFDCIIAIEVPDARLETAVRSVCQHSDVAKVSPNLPGLPDEEGLMFLRRNTLGYRAADAAETLKSEIRANLNLLALYQQKGSPAIRAEAWVFREGFAETIPSSRPTLNNLHGRKRALPLARQAASALLDPAKEPAIRAALDLHQLALSMPDQRLRLVNLWSALECLASLVDGGSIISRVEQLVVPILTWRKIDTVVRYLAINIHFWLEENPQIEPALCPFPLGNKNNVSPERILTLLTQPKDSAGIRALLNLVSGHPLLLYRINTAWAMFSEPSQLSGNLSRSGTRLTWHLWRIYRARNLVVHQGIEPPCLPQLANHLQQYFSWTLSRIIHGLTLGPQWTARDSWYYWKAKSDHVMDSLPKTARTLTVGDMFPEKLESPEFPVWG